MNGGTGLRFRSFVVTSLTTNVLLRFGDDLIRLRLVVDQNLVLFEVLIEAAGLDSLLVDLEQRASNAGGSFALRFARSSSTQS
jgi:chitinase